MDRCTGIYDRTLFPHRVNNSAITDTIRDTIAITRRRHAPGGWQLSFKKTVL